MKLFILTNFEELSLLEVSELIGVKGKLVGSGIIEVKVKEKDLMVLCSRGQSFKRVLVGLSKVSALNKVKFSEVEDYFWKDCSFKIEIEGVKGNENRIEIGREIGNKIFSQVEEELGFKPEIDFKKPEVVVYIYFDGKNYFLGIDLIGYELNKRNYRVFVNSASFKGDLGYYLVRTSGFVKGEKLVVGFVKDGTTLIEAGLFESGKIVNKKFSFERLPVFKDLDEFLKESKTTETNISGFDESMMNIRAVKKNAQIAKVEVKVNKFSLDELDVKFSEQEIDRLIFQITKKDEDKLNEIYYQANYVLRKKGVVLIICREGWEISISDKFKLLSSEVIKRGTSGYRVWVLEKK